MIHGETVTVLHPSPGVVDEFGQESTQWVREIVENVLVAPDTTSNVEGSIRVAGDSLSLILHFPSTYTDSLRGCRIEVRGSVYEVEGDPQPYTVSPLAWNRPVKVTLMEG